MKDTYKKHINFILGSLILLTFGIILGITFSSQNPFRKNIDRDNISVTPVDTSKYYEQARFDMCIKNAEAEYTAAFELNSYPAPRDGYPDARTWNDSHIKERTEDNFRKDKEFCLKLYKE